MKCISHKFFFFSEKHFGKISIDEVRLEGEKQRAILGGRVDITCRIIDPSEMEVQVMWQKNGKRADDDDKRQIWIRDGTFPKEKREKVFILTLKNVTVEDEGNWTCSVKGGQPASVQRKTFILRTGKLWHEGYAWGEGVQQREDNHRLFKEKYSF